MVFDNSASPGGLLNDPGPAGLEIFRTVFRDAPQGMVILDAAGGILAINHSAEVLLGLSAGEQEAGAGAAPRWHAIREDGSPFPPEARPTMEALRTGRPVEQVLMGMVKPHLGETTWVEVSAFPVIPPGQTRPTHTFASLVDVTPRRKAELALGTAEANLARTFQASPLPMVLSDLEDGRTLEVNAAFLELFGLPKEDLVGRTSLDLGLVAPEARQGLLRSLQDEHAFHDLLTEVEAKDGRRLTCLLSGETISLSGRPRLLTLWQDITERRRAEVEIHRLNGLLKASQSLSMVGGWELDLVHETLQWTEETYRIHELNPAEFTPTLATAVGFYTPEGLPLIMAAVRKAGTEGQAFDLELELLTAKGRRIWVHAAGHPVHTGGRITGVVGVFQEITQRKLEEAEKVLLLAQLAQAQKMESLGSLAGGIALDMNNVLGAILALASLNLNVHPEASVAHTAFATIAEAATRGGQLVKGLLTFARKTPAEALPLDLNSIVWENVALLAHTTLARIVLTTELAPDLWPILGDRSALSHALMNLGVNAADAMGQDGRLTLRTRNLEPNWVELSTEDNGSGMAPEVLARALEPFFTTKAPGAGTGLGLSSVYSTVTAHGGTLELQSAPGRGTVVRMRFPKALAGTVATTRPDAPEAPGQAKASLRVLLVDDDDLILKTSALLLEALGQTVLTAASGEEALAKLADRADPDLMILDLNMPGLGGAETLVAVRALHPDLPIIIATGRADQAALDLVERHPRVSLLPKPFALEDLQAMLAELDQPR
jgi:PAS domain S-box-containing protein